MGKENRNNIAGWLMVGIFSLTLVFHLLIVSGVVPYAIVWGGRLHSKQEMYRFEAISILINCIFLFIVLVKLRVVKTSIPARLTTAALWLMCAVFLLNTLGNLFSQNRWEQLIFTPLTLLQCIAAFLLARKQR